MFDECFIGKGCFNSILPGIPPAWYILVMIGVQTLSSSVDVVRSRRPSQREDSSPRSKTHLRPKLSTGGTAKTCGHREALPGCFVVSERANPRGGVQSTVWLLEVNRAPSMESATTMKHHLCAACTRDLIRVVVEGGRNGTGRFVQIH